VNKTLEALEQASPEARGASATDDTLPEPPSLELYAIRPLPERATVAGHLLQKVWRKEGAVKYFDVAGPAEPKLSSRLFQFRTPPIQFTDRLVSRL
jgi:hypothetical protein